MNPLQMQWLQSLQPQNQGRNFDLPRLHNYLPAMPSAPRPQVPMPEIGDEESSPIQLGSRAALSSAEMTDEQKRRAEGLAIMQFFSQLGKSKSHNQLGAINESFMPAMQAYREEAAYAQAENAANQKRQDAFDKEMRDEVRRSELTPYQQQRLALEERKLEEKANKVSNKDFIMPPSSNVELPEGAIPLSDISSNKQLLKDYTKDLVERKNRYAPMNKNVKNYDKLADILDKNPNLYNSFAMYMKLQEDKDKDPSAFNLFTKKLRKKDLEQIEIASKLIDDIAINTMKSFPGRPTDLVKKTILGSLPRPGMTPTAAREVIMRNREEDARIRRDAMMANDGWKNRYYVPEQFEGETPAPQQAISGESEQNLGALLADFDKEHPEYANQPTEEKIKALKLLGIYK